jgi:alkanesulfonate monooxygenase
MKLKFGNDAVDVFSISPRTTDEVTYWNDVKDIVSLSERFDCSGVLCFAGNDTMIEPWLVAHYVCTASRHLRPLVALNPLYMHPFTAAKMVSSFALMHRRRTHLNLIIGTSTVDHETFCDTLTHDERYERLTEYASLVKRLLFDVHPVSHQGRFYALKKAMIRPRPDNALLPSFYVAGHSEAAKRTINTIGAITLTMMAPELEAGLAGTPGRTAVYLGIISRPRQEEAWAVANARYAPHREGEQMLDFSMRYTEAQWKIRLKQALASNLRAKPGYWLEPFRSFRADCPYFVGSYQEVATMIVGHVNAGTTSFVLDMWPTEEDFFHVHESFKLAQKALVDAT